jgi:hypothetical protein
MRMKTGVATVTGIVLLLVPVSPAVAVTNGSRIRTDTPTLAWRRSMTVPTSTSVTVDNQVG